MYAQKYTYIYLYNVILLNFLCLNGNIRYFFNFKELKSILKNPNMYLRFEYSQLECKLDFEVLYNAKYIRSKYDG